MAAGKACYTSKTTLFMCIVIIICAISVVVARTDLYQRVDVTQCTPDLTISRDLSNDEPIELVAVNLTGVTSQEACHINLKVSAPEDRKLKVGGFSGEFHVPVENNPGCGISVEASDPVIGGLQICHTLDDAVVQGDPNLRRGTPYYASGNSVDVTITIDVSYLEKDPQFDIIVEAYSSTETDGCFLCNGDNVVCIHKDLTCDGIDNCPNGEDELYDNTNDLSCTFVCDNDRILERDNVCNGKEDCIDGKDEEESVCGAVPWSTLSTVDIVISSICAVLLVLMCGLFMWYYTHPPVVKKYQKKYKIMKSRRERMVHQEQLKQMSKDNEDTGERQENQSRNEDVEAAGSSADADDTVKEDSVKSYL
ncbi:uncharacterized protein LOC144444828 [Glandiceps talaboti]